MAWPSRTPTFRQGHASTQVVALHVEKALLATCRLQLCLLEHVIALEKHCACRCMQV